jgi:hypothetical protein
MRTAEAFQLLAPADQLDAHRQVRIGDLGAVLAAGPWLL